MKPLGGAVLLIGALLLVSSALGGGISDETCPNVRGENTNTCPSGTVGVPYAIRFVEREGSGCGPDRQTFHFDSGALPPDLTLTPDGTLSGVPSVPGTFRFYVEMREPVDDPEHCAGKRTQKQFTLTVRRTPWLVSTALPRAEVGLPFLSRLRARGGSGSFTWRLVTGRLPSGLRVGSDGSIRGRPRASGSYIIEVRATDTESRSVVWSGSLDVSARLRIPPKRLPEARVAQRFSTVVRTTGGAGAVKWRVESGRLPRGIRFDPRTGRLFGSAREAGRFVVLLAATDELRATHTRAFVLRVVAKARRQTNTTARPSRDS
jgi:hypothetical protein